MPEFTVDNDALLSTADAIDRAITQTQEQPISALSDHPAVFGHDSVARAFSGFCQRWQSGLEALARDGAEIAARLAHTSATYTAADQAAQTALRPIDEALPHTAVTALEAH